MPVLTMATLSPSVATVIQKIISVHSAKPVMNKISGTGTSTAPSLSTCTLHAISFYPLAVVVWVSPTSLVLGGSSSPPANPTRVNKLRFSRRARTERRLNAQPDNETARIRMTP